MSPRSVRRCPRRRAPSKADDRRNRPGWDSARWRLRRRIRLSSRPRSAARPPSDPRATGARGGMPWPSSSLQREKRRSHGTTAPLGAPRRAGVMATWGGWVNHGKSGRLGRVPIRWVHGAGWVHSGRGASGGKRACLGRLRAGGCDSAWGGVQWAKALSRQRQGGWVQWNPHR